MNIKTKSRRFSPLLLVLGLFGTNLAMAATVDSVFIQYNDSPPKMVILGASLMNSTITLGGVPIPSTCVVLNTETELNLEFCNEATTAVPGQGSYKLVIDGTEYSVYAEQAIVTPPMPPIGADCPCTAEWDNALGYVDGTGTYIPGTTALTKKPSVECAVAPSVTPPYNEIATTLYLDPYDVLAEFTYPQYPIGSSFYPGYPSASYCQMVEINSTPPYTTSLADQPLSSQEQQDDCANYMLDKLNEIGEYLICGGIGDRVYLP